MRTRDAIIFEIFKDDSGVAKMGDLIKADEVWNAAANRFVKEIEKSAGNSAIGVRIVEVAEEIARKMKEEV